MSAPWNSSYTAKDWKKFPEIESHAALQEKLDREVSSKDVINVEKVVDDILAHPHRKHFGTLNIPNAETKKEHEGIFGMGIPENVLFSFGHWYRMSQPLEKAREEYLVCKHNAPKRASPTECLEEAKNMFNLYLHMSEIPFRTCPKQTADYTYCVETQGHRKPGMDYGARSFTSFVRYCLPEQQAFEECLGKAYGCKFPPAPAHGEFYQRSARFTNLPWDNIYA
eukprot:GGOE01054480.1.p2 GENE.GGOE01054480.1~~GGOE01054480.1.p2  ORF type:complete len:224 (-),score=42.69 GGOE01054480.1:72-743(-)